MSLSRTIWSMGLLIVLTSAAYGDLAPARSPLPKPPMVAPVKIVEGKVDNLDPNVVAKIIIPSSLLPDLQERSQGAQISNESHFDGMTVIAGLALTAAAISLMFANKTSPHWKKGVAGLIGCILLVGIALLASFFFPPKFVAPTVDQSKPQRLIVIEVQKDGHEVTLVLPGSR
jgi:hypothetical protein